jgi:hypothetical protein
MGTFKEFMDYLRTTNRLRQFNQVTVGCRILGLKRDEITIDSVEQAYKTQRESPGVHSKLAEEMAEARDNIIRWIRENPEWRQIPRS